jgi:hypothetical protein
LDEREPREPAVPRVGGDTSQIPRPQPMMNARSLHFFDGMDGNGHRLFPLMNRSANYDSTDPGFKIPPSDTARIKSFLYYRWYDSETIEWSYAPELSLQRIWPLAEDLSYANPTRVNAGMNGFPLGDLYRWWPGFLPKRALNANAKLSAITFSRTSATNCWVVF